MGSEDLDGEWNPTILAHLFQCFPALPESRYSVESPSLVSCRSIDLFQPGGFGWFFTEAYIARNSEVFVLEIFPSTTVITCMVSRDEAVWLIRRMITGILIFKFPKGLSAVRIGSLAMKEGFLDRSAQERPVRIGQEESFKCSTCTGPNRCAGSRRANYL